jgi:hypothetical protein
MLCYLRGIAPILQVQLCILVHDYYYVQVYWRGFAPILLITDYKFSTSMLCYWRGFAPILPIQLRSTGLLPILRANLLMVHRFHTSNNRLLVSDQYAMLLKGHCSPTPSITPLTGLQPVLRASLLKGPCSHTFSTPPFCWFTTGITCKFAEKASLPYFQ